MPNPERKPRKRHLPSWSIPITTIPVHVHHSKVLLLAERAAVPEPPEIRLGCHGEEERTEGTLRREREVTETLLVGQKSRGPKLIWMNCKEGLGYYASTQKRKENNSSKED